MPQYFQYLVFFPLALGAIGTIAYFIFSEDEPLTNQNSSENNTTNPSWGFKLGESFNDPNPDSSAKRAIALLESKNDLGTISNFQNAISYGIYQFISRTTNGGYSPLKELIGEYKNRGGTYAQQLLSYGDISNGLVANNSEVQSLLKQAAQNDSARMRAAQEAIADRYYFAPARQFMSEQGLDLTSDANFNRLIVYDAFIHYGPDTAKREIRSKGIAGWLQHARDNHSYTGIAKEYHLFRYQMFLEQAYQQNRNWGKVMWIRWKYWGSWERIQLA